MSEIPNTHRLATSEEVSSMKLRLDLETRLAQLALEEQRISSERKVAQTLLAHHPDAGAAANLDMIEHAAGWLVKK